MTQLVINLSMLGSKPTGLGVYSENCAKALAQRYRVGIIAGHGYSPEGDIIAQAPESVSIGSGKLAAIRRQLWSRTITLEKGQFLYSPTHHGLPKVNGQVITVHDLICLRHPTQHRPQYLFFRFILPKLLKRCAALFTVSETTRQDISETYRFPLDRIFVVPNGVDTNSFSADPAQRTADPYLLMVGARYPHKNVEEVLENARSWSEQFRLVVTSCSGKYREFLEHKLADLKLTDRVAFLDYVDRDQLIRLYQGCTALLYPSKWEGFGIPPLEALACGSPVIASDIPVHREVLGDSAFFVNLGDETSWATAFEAIQCQREVSAKVDAAKGVLSRFTWENSAKKLVDSLLTVEPNLTLSGR